MIKRKDRKIKEVPRQGGKLNWAEVRKIPDQKKMKSVFIVLFSLINYCVGKQGLALVVHYLFLLPGLLQART